MRCNTKITLLLGLLVSLFATCGISIAGPTLPYRAFAATADIEVRSGAGEEYYVTGTIAQNAEVEVHQHLVGGWLAIRPPEDSFSWVFGRHIELIDPTHGRINKNDVPSRIGSRHHDQRQVVQIRFHKNEQVVIVGQEEQNGQRWYQIAPPSGEFRYVRARDLETEPVIPQVPVTDLQQQAAENKGGWIARTSHDRPSDKSSSAEGKNTERPPTLAVSDTSSASPTVETTPSQLPTAEVPSLNGPGAEQDQSTLPERSTSAGQPVAPATSGLSTTAGELDPDFTRQLVSLDLQLSQTVVQQRNSWQLEELTRQTGSLLNKATTVSEREAAQYVLQKIDRFAKIQQRGHQTLSGRNLLIPQQGHVAPLAVGAITQQTHPASHPMATSPSFLGLPDISGMPSPRPPSARKRHRRYVAEGLLQPVVSGRPNAPQYALVDGTGKVISFVNPTPDVNLKPFLGQRVGVVGRQAYLPDLRQTLVTAGRVTPLDDASFRR